MNAIPFYAIWSTQSGSWFGCHIEITQTFNKTKAIERCLFLRPAYGHSYDVIESWGEGHYDEVVYSNVGRTP